MSLSRWRPLSAWRCSARSQTNRTRSLVAEGHQVAAALSRGYQLALLIAAGCVLVGLGLSPFLLRTNEPPEEKAAHIAENMENPEAYEHLVLCGRGSVGRHREASGDSQSSGVGGREQSPGNFHHVLKDVDECSTAVCACVALGPNGTVEGDVVMTTVPDGLPRLALPHGGLSLPLLTSAEAASGLCSILWLVTATTRVCDPSGGRVERFGQVVDLAGLAPENGLPRLLRSNLMPSRPSPTSTGRDRMVGAGSGAEFS